MSDLFCPATLLLTAAADVDGLRTAGGPLPGVRLAALWCGEAEERTTALAAALAVPLRVADGLAEPPGAPSGDQVAVVADELESIGDQHRGETVLVVGGASLFRAAARLARTGRDTAAADPPAAGETVMLEVDADGWVARRRCDDAPSGSGLRRR